jgi:hypothetical protein
MVRALSVFFRVAIAAPSALLLAGCDPISPPFMQNALSVPIEVAIAYTDATQTHDLWQPQMTVACGRADAEILDLTVEASGHTIHHLSAADVRRMLQSVSNPRAVVWEIRRSAITPVAKR